MIRVAILQAALGGPVVAGLAWLGLARWPWVGGPVAGVLALGAHAAAWGVLISAYRAEEVVWRGYQPDLLGATIVVVTELALLLAAFRAADLAEGRTAPAFMGIAVSATAVAALSYTGSLGVVALAVPLPTIAVAVAALSGRGRQDARGLIGLAAADVLALIGLSLVYARAGSVVVGEAGGAGPALLLLAAFIKSGAIPGLATWRVSATGGPGAWLDGAMRGQAIALAVLATLTMRSSAPASALAVGSAVAILAGGLVALWSRTRARTLASVTGAAAGMPFLALGLGGAVGTRAFLLLFPAFLLAAALVGVLGRGDPDEQPVGAHPGAWGWLGACALGIGLASLLGMPPGGGFPGTWLALSLAATRAEVTAGWLLAAGAAGVGLALAMKASIALIRAARSTPVLAMVGTVVGLVLVYFGTQPIRVAIGWWVRVETALGLPEVLPSAGAPGLPAVGGSRLMLALAPSLLLVVLVVALGRGVRDPGTGFVSLRPTEGAPTHLGGRARALGVTLSSAARPAVELLDRLRSTGVGFGVAALLEVAALLLAGRIVVLAARAGYL